MKKKSIKHQRKIVKVCILEFKGTVLRMCNDRKDLRGCIIQKRLTNICGLVYEEALYHDDCRKKFFTVLPASHSAVAQQRDDQVDRSMEKINKWDWRHSLNDSVPTGTNAPPTPPNILKMTFCISTKGYSAACGCRKEGNILQQRLCLQ